VGAVNRTELIEALAQHYDGSRSEAAKALQAVVQTITRSTASGEKVAITGFGVFEKVDRPARTVRNPRTGERKEAPPTSVPRFRPGTELKAYVAGERPLPDGDAPVRVPARRAAPQPAEPTVEATAPVVSDLVGQAGTGTGTVASDTSAKADPSAKAAKAAKDGKATKVSKGAKAGKGDKAGKAKKDVKDAKAKKDDRAKKNGKKGK